MDNVDVKKILVIDDEEYIRDSMIGFLEDFGFDVINAENGRMGLKKFEKENPDLVLCDLRMPEMDGLEVLKRVTQINSKIPIIIISGAGNFSDTLGTLRLGAWDYIIKPMQDMNVLYHAINKAFERAEFLREKRQYQKDLENARKEFQDTLETLEKTRDQLEQSEKTAVIGKRVAQVAHDITSPIENGVTAASFLDAQLSEFKKKYTSGDLKTGELEHYFQIVEKASTSILMNMEQAAQRVAGLKQVTAGK